MVSPAASRADIVAAIATLPGDLRTGVLHWFERLDEQHGPPRAGVLPGLTRIVASSDFAARVLLRHWAEFCTTDGGLEILEQPPDVAALAQFADDVARSNAPKADVMTLLRAERNRRLTHILWRDVNGGASVDDTLRDLSRVADELLRAASAYADARMRERYGCVRDADGEPVPLVILGMGKLGGEELNFSSDIDLVFTYARDGSSDGEKSLHAQQYFDRLSRAIISLLDQPTADGFVFRVDTRLRPFGDSGPPVVSFAALESYLLQHGRDWERYAYVKARVVGPRPAAAIRRELFDELILPFVFRRYLDYGVFESLRDMHAKIAQEVRRRELRDNVKLGPGGIREIEFIVQSLQLVRGGSRTELKTPSLQGALLSLADSRGVGPKGAAALASAYRFLRRIENCLQAMRDEQTHDLPEDKLDRLRLVVAMGFADWPTLAAEIDRQRGIVAAQFDDIARRGAADADNPALRGGLIELWDRAADENEWRKFLAAQNFREPGKIAGQVARFRNAASTQTVGTTAARRLRTFVPRLLTLARDCDHPARAVARSLSVIDAVLRRSAYVALLNENRVAAERLVRLCERSAYIAEQLARYPVLLDELLDPRLLSGPMSKAELTDELEAELAKHTKPDRGADAEQHMERLVRFQRANMFRIAVADFSGTLPIMKVSDSLTFLAEAVLEDALSLAWRDLTAKHGVPRYEADGARRPAGLGIIAYGKLGGLELSYGSDLDVVFLHDSRGSKQETDGDRPLDNAIFFARLVRRLVHFLTTQTSTGALYEIDTRLRPSGRKGLLVTNTDAFERYQEENAWTWEHQALLRARAVAGSPEIGAEFARIRADTLTRRVRRDTLRDDVAAMRARMRDELDRSDDKRFDLKQGRGGIADIEFLVQYLVLRHAAEKPAVIEFTDNIRELDALAAGGVVPGERAARLQEIYRNYRLRQHHLVLDGEPPLVPNDEFAAERAEVTEGWADHLGA